MRPRSLAILLLGLAAPAALAQDKLAPPSEQTTKSPADQPITATPDTPDADIAAFLKALHGTYRSEAAGDRPAIVLHAAAIGVESLADTELVEVTRADAPATPFRVYLLHPYRRQGVLRIRQFELPAGLKDALVGCWAAPDALPRLDAALLTASLDMPLSSAKGAPTEYHAATDHPFPTMRDGAIEMTAAMDLSPSALRMTDAGFDADGRQVWGAKPDKPEGAIEFKRVVPAPAPAQRDDTGIVIIPLVPPAPDAAKHETGGEITFHYSTWLANGQLVESSRTAGRQPASVRVPSNILSGLNKGLTGIAKGERRRIIIPPAQAYADVGRGVIPPNATILFDVECLKIDNASAGTPAPSAPMVNPHTGERPPPPPAPTNPDTPIGNPPTNPGPETPRH